MATTPIWKIFSPDKGTPVVPLSGWVGTLVNSVETALTLIATKSKRVFSGGYTANAAPGGQTVFTVDVPVKDKAQAGIMRIMGSGGFGGSAGYVAVAMSWTGGGVTVSSNGKSYGGSPTDASGENGSYFPAAQFVMMGREFEVRIPANVSCSLRVYTDASVAAYYRLSARYEVLVSGEF